MTTAELTAALDAANTGTPEQSVESAVAVYLAASAEIDAYTAVKDAAKKLISDVMAETAHTAARHQGGQGEHHSAVHVGILRR